MGTLTNEMFPVNSEYHELDPIATPDGSYLIFLSNRPGGHSFSDLYVCFRKEKGGWTRPINLGKRINSYQHQNTACITPDGKYFFFTTSDPTDAPKGEVVESPLIDKVGDIDLYWVETGFIAYLGRDLMMRTNAAEIIDLEYRTNGLQPSLAMLDRLYREGAGQYDFPLPQLLSICAGMMREGRMEAAEALYAALLRTLPEPRRVQQGFAAVCIFNDHADRGIEVLKDLWTRHPEYRSERGLESVTSTLGFTGKSKDEMLLLRFVAREFPVSSPAHFSLASALHRQGDNQRAIDHCLRALELKPDSAEAIQLLEELEQR
jgi:tetratricopeptide (TPR) repeat protein